MTLPQPDTHCLDEDTQTDCWSYSKSQLEAYGKAVAAECAAGILTKGADMTDKKPPKLTVIASASQESLSQKLLNELREACDKPEYGDMYFSTTIGVLEMLKMELYASITP